MIPPTNGPPPVASTNPVAQAMASPAAAPVQSATNMATMTASPSAAHAPAVPQFGVASTNFGPMQPAQPQPQPQQAMAPAQYQQPYQAPQPPNWQQFQQYAQQLPQQQGFQGYGQQRMAAYGYGQPQQPPMMPPRTAPQMLSPGVGQGATAIEQPQQVRPPPSMNPVQAAMGVRAPQTPVAPQTMATPHPVTAAPTLATNPVHQAIGAPQLAMSDATKKVIVQPSLADDFLDRMKPYSYRYKDPAMEPRVQPTGGTYLGVMAQDLERVPDIGHQLVVDTPHGKMVDQKVALSATMAGLARLNQRVRALESDVTKKGKK